MQSDAQNASALRTQFVMAGFLSVWCVIFCYEIFSGFHYYSEIDNTFDKIKNEKIEDEKIKAVVHAITEGGRNVTGYIIVYSFLLGVAALAIYDTLKKIRAAKTTAAASPSSAPAASPNVDHPNFYYIGMAGAIVTALFGAICCYVGYYTVDDVLDYKALELGKLVLGYAAVQLALWTWAIYHCKKQAAT